MKRILIVDDDDQILSSLAMLLAEEFDVQVASGGRQALARLRFEEFDLVLLDLLMPEVDGAEVLAELARRGTRIPVILMSADPNLAKRAAQYGVPECLEKPFHIDALEAMLERVLGERAGAGGP